MLTRNELLDRLIDLLEDKQVDLYREWYSRDTLTSWENSYEHIDYQRISGKIMELVTQYD